MPLPPLSLDDKSEAGDRFAPPIPGIHALILDIVDDEGAGAGEGAGLAGDEAEEAEAEAEAEEEEEEEDTDLARALLKR